MSPHIDVERATDADLAYVARLCREAGLPTDDLYEAPATFYLGRDGGLVAVGGIEDCGPAGLLRSVAVPEEERGQGYGVAMVDALVGRAHNEYDRLYLLTTDAAGFFAEQGFEPVERRATPEGVQETAQFADLCPTGATVMRRSLC